MGWLNSRSVDTVTFSQTMRINDFISRDIRKGNVLRALDENGKNCVM
jgi:hypothetical protein